MVKWGSFKISRYRYGSVRGHHDSVKFSGGSIGVNGTQLGSGEFSRDQCRSIGGRGDQCGSVGDRGPQWGSVGLNGVSLGS